MTAMPPAETDSMIAMPAATDIEMQSSAAPPRRGALARAAMLGGASALLFAGAFLASQRRGAMPARLASMWRDIAQNDDYSVDDDYSDDDLVSFCHYWTEGECKQVPTCEWKSSTSKCIDSVDADDAWETAGDDASPDDDYWNDDFSYSEYAQTGKKD